MIFITLGSQKFQFNRLLKEIDTIVEKNLISEEIFAQTGYSDYKPRFYRYKDFLDYDAFVNKIDKSRLVITHGGTGAIINAVKAKKKVIAVPRLAKYGEHVDDHQKQIVDVFSNMGYVVPCYDTKNLYTLISSIKNKKIKPYVSNTHEYILNISEFIDKI